MIIPKRFVRISNFVSIDISKDPLYRKGFREGWNEVRRERVERLINMTDLDDKLIASTLQVTVKFVRETRKNLSKQ